MRTLGAFLVATGLLLLSVRTLEHILGGFVGEVSLGGATFTVPGLPLIPVGGVALVVGSLLWRRGGADR